MSSTEKRPTALNDDALGGVSGGIDWGGGGGAGGQTLYGDGGNQNFQGTSGNDVMYGNGGQDTFNGGAGSDLMIGGSGDDRFVSGPGNDTAWGNEGNDTFVYNPTEHASGERSEFGGSVGNDTLVLQGINLSQLQQGLTLDQGSNVRAIVTEQNGNYVIQFAYPGQSSPMTEFSGTFRMNGAELRFHGMEQLVIPKA